MKNLILSVSDEEAIKTIEFTLNGKTYEIDLSNYQEKQIQYRIEIERRRKQYNSTATNFDGAKGEFEGTCNYNP